MNYFTTIISIIAFILIIFNATKIDFNTPFEGQSIIALITIAGSFCAIFLLQILRISKTIQKKTK